MVSKTLDDGRGIFTVGRYPEYAHRVSYVLNKGNIPSGLVVRHSCDNPTCVNPKHLLLGTHQDNVADRVNRNRSAIGERNGRSKLNPEQVKEILASADTPTILGKRYHVDPRLIVKIKKREIWKHL